jgi:ribosomal protein L11
LHAARSCITFTVMVRPLIPNREAVKGTIFTMKLTPTERALLGQLVTHREGELAGLTGQRIEVSASAFVRWLFIERARQVGIDVKVPIAIDGKWAAMTHERPAPVVPEKATSSSKPSRKPRAAKVAPPTVERVRARVAELVEGGAKAKDLAAAAHVDAGALSKFRKGGPLGETKLAALWAACTKLAG